MRSLRGWILIWWLKNLSLRAPYVRHRFNQKCRRIRRHWTRRSATPPRETQIGVLWILCIQKWVHVTYRVRHLFIPHTSIEGRFNWDTLFKFLARKKSTFDIITLYFIFYVFYMKENNTGSVYVCQSEILCRLDSCQINAVLALQQLRSRSRPSTFNPEFFCCCQMQSFCLDGSRSRSWVKSVWTRLRPKSSREPAINKKRDPDVYDNNNKKLLYCSHYTLLIKLPGCNIFPPA